MQKKETLTFKESFMDFIVAPFDFDATSANVTAKSLKAKSLFAEKFGIGAVSIEVRKSALPEVVAKLESDGYNVAVI